MKIILDVPKIKQAPLFCAPCSMAMVFNYYGFNLDQKEIAKNLKRGYNGYFDNHDIPRYAIDLGFFAKEESNLSIEYLIQKINKGNPIIVRTCYLSNKNAAHSMVVKGYDDFLERLFFNDPYDLGRSAIRFNDFLGIWKVGDKYPIYSYNYGIIIEPKSEKYYLK
jgi:uncharacterized protein YvpB